jgi:hypothetical protein
MNSNELRIGNWVMCEGKPTKVDEIFIGAFKHLKAEPIELTAEVLEKAGFVMGDGNVYNHHFFHKKESLWEFCVNPENGVCFIEWKQDSIKSKSVKYLHQLQNLFCCLTGNELNITLC